MYIYTYLYVYLYLCRYKCERDSAEMFSIEIHVKLEPVSHLQWCLTDLILLLS